MPTSRELKEAWHRNLISLYEGLDKLERTSMLKQKIKVIGSLFEKADEISGVSLEAATELEATAWKELEKCLPEIAAHFKEKS